MEEEYANKTVSEIAKKKDAPVEKKSAKKTQSKPAKKEEKPKQQSKPKKSGGGLFGAKKVKKNMTVKKVVKLIGSSKRH